MADKPTQVVRNFSSANPAQFGKTGGDVDAVSRLAAIERRALAIKERVRAQHENNKDSWSAREAIRLWQQHAQQAAKYPVPKGVVTDIAPQSLMNKARQNVEARTLGRLSRVNEIKTRMQNSVIRNSVSQEKMAVKTDMNLRQKFRNSGPSQ